MPNLASNPEKFQSKKENYYEEIVSAYEKELLKGEIKDDYLESLAKKQNEKSFLEKAKDAWEAKTDFLKYLGYSFFGNEIMKKLKNSFFGEMFGWKEKYEETKAEIKEMIKTPVKKIKEVFENFNKSEVPLKQKNQIKKIKDFLEKNPEIAKNMPEDKEEQKKWWQDLLNKNTDFSESDQKVLIETLTAESITTSILSGLSFLTKNTSEKISETYEEAEAKAKEMLDTVEGLGNAMGSWVDFVSDTGGELIKDLDKIKDDLKKYVPDEFKNVIDVISPADLTGLSSLTPVQWVAEFIKAGFSNETFEAIASGSKRVFETIFSIYIAKSLVFNSRRRKAILVFLAYGFYKKNELVKTGFDSAIFGGFNLLGEGVSAFGESMNRYGADNLGKVLENQAEYDFLEFGEKLIEAFEKDGITWTIIGGSGSVLEYPILSFRLGTEWFFLDPLKGYGQSLIEAVSGNYENALKTAMIGQVPIMGLSAGFNTLKGKGVFKSFLTSYRASLPYLILARGGRMKSEMFLRGVLDKPLKVINTLNVEKINQMRIKYLAKKIALADYFGDTKKSGKLGKELNKIIGNLENGTEIKIFGEEFKKTSKWNTIDELDQKIIKTTKANWSEKPGFLGRSYDKVKKGGQKKARQMVGLENTEKEVLNNQETNSKKTLDPEIEKSKKAELEKIEIAKKAKQEEVLTEIAKKKESLNQVTKNLETEVNDLNQSKQKLSEELDTLKETQIDIEEKLQNLEKTEESLNKTLKEKTLDLETKKTELKKLEDLEEIAKKSPDELVKKADDLKKVLPEKVQDLDELSILKNKETVILGEADYEKLINQNDELMQKADDFLNKADEVTKAKPSLKSKLANKFDNLKTEIKTNKLGVATKIFGYSLGGFRTYQGGKEFLQGVDELNLNKASKGALEVAGGASEIALETTAVQAGLTAKLGRFSRLGASGSAILLSAGIESGIYMGQKVLESWDEEERTASTWAKKSSREELIYDLYTTLDEVSARDSYRVLTSEEALMYKQKEIREKLFKALILKEELSESNDKSKKILNNRLTYIKSLTHNFLPANLKDIEKLLSDSKKYALGINILTEFKKAKKEEILRISPTEIIDLSDNYLLTEKDLKTVLRVKKVYEILSEKDLETMFKNEDKEILLKNLNQVPSNIITSLYKKLGVFLLKRQEEKKELPPRLLSFYEDLEKYVNLKSLTVSQNKIENFEEKNLYVSIDYLYDDSFSPEKLKQIVFEIDKTPFAFALYKIAEMYGYTGKGDLKSLKHFFSRDNAEKLGIYFDGEWYVNKEGLDWDQSVGNEENEESVKKMCEIIENNSDNILGSRADSIFRFAGSSIDNKLEEQALMVKDSLKEGVKEYYKIK
jgi:hypothetical protein